MSHEQSETVQAPDGSWVNVYGRSTPQAGKRLPGMPAYPTLEAAESAARARAEEFGKPGTALADFLHRAYGVAMTPLPELPDLGPQVEALKARGRGLADLLPSLPAEMPTAPEWMQRYMVERGLLPELRHPVN